MAHQLPPTLSSKTGGGSSSEGSGAGLTTFNDTSTAGHATLTNYGMPSQPDPGGATVFTGSSSADSAILIANGTGDGGAIIFVDDSTGGTARVKVFDAGYLDISQRQPGVTIGSIEGSGNVSLGANRLTVGTNNINTSFSGVISGTGLLSKIGSGVLTLQANDCIADTVGLVLVSGSSIKLDFTGSPDVIASLKVNGVPQPPGIYGGPMSGAPHILPEFRGSGTVSVGGQPPPPPPPRPLTIIQPNGGEVWSMGSVQEIRWDSTNLKRSDHLILQYSRDGGATWFRIAQNIPAFTFGYWWQVDNFPTTQGRIKILLQEDRSITDQSNANFTVQRVPYITLLRPNGGEVWTIGQYQNIHWSRQNPGGNTVDIDYSVDNGTTWIRIATQAEDTGFYLWNVPGPATTTAKARIRFHETPSVTDTSEAVFTIVSP